MEVFDLGVMSQASVFPKTPDESVLAGPLTLVKCLGCGLVQLAHDYGRGDIDNGNYGYRSGLNKSMIRHLKNVATTAMEFRPEARSVLDIGANDGTLLSVFPPSMHRCAVDPNLEQFREHYYFRADLIPEYFSAAVVGHGFDIITSIAMLYDLPDPMAFVHDVHQCLNTGGIWITEQSYLPAMLKCNSYDTICHEHLEYYGLEQLAYMEHYGGFKIIHWELTETNGGSLLVVLQKGHGTFDSGILIDERKQTGIEAFMDFERRVEYSRCALLTTLEGYNIVHGIGASTKGNIILQYCKPEIDCIMEVNPDKIGRVTPGTNIPIVSEADSRVMDPDAYLVLPWHFREAMEERYPNDTLIFPLGGEDND